MVVVLVVVVVVSCKNPQLTNHPTCALFAPLGTLPLARMLPALEQLWFPGVECRVTVEASISTGMNSSWLQRPTPLTRSLTRLCLAPNCRIERLTSGDSSGSTNTQETTANSHAASSPPFAWTQALSSP